jgi:hypothetical protein
MDLIDRRLALGLFAGAVATPLLAKVPAAAPAGPIMWRDPGCGCCIAWARKIEAALGLKLKMVDSPDMAAVKRAQGVPADLQGCHTALIGGFVIEGHVPAEDIRRLLSTRQKGVRLLAVPGMPAGTPGMEAAQYDPYRVFAVEKGGRRWVFSIHG